MPFVGKANVCMADTKCGKETLNAFGILESRLKTSELLFKPSIADPEH